MEEFRNEAREKIINLLLADYIDRHAGDTKQLEQLKLANLLVQMGDITCFKKLISENNYDPNKNNLIDDIFMYCDFPENFELIEFLMKYDLNCPGEVIDILLEQSHDYPQSEQIRPCVKSLIQNLLENKKIDSDTIVYHCFGSENYYELGDHSLIARVIHHRNNELVMWMIDNGHDQDDVLGEAIKEMNFEIIDYVFGDKHLLEKYICEDGLIFNLRDWYGFYYEMIDNADEIIRLFDMFQSHGLASVILEKDDAGKTIWDDIKEEKKEHKKYYSENKEYRAKFKKLNNYFRKLSKKDNS